MVVFDPDTGTKVHHAEQRDPTLLWTRQLNAMDWSTEGRTAPTVHHTVHQGFRPEGITQEMLALYGDRVDRSLLPTDETAPLVVTTRCPTSTIVAHHELALDDFPTSPIFVPRDPGADPSRSALRGPGPGGHDGFVVVPILNDDGFRVEVFDAGRRGPRPRCDVIGKPGSDGSVRPALGLDARRCLGRRTSSGLRFADELDRIGELDPTTSPAVAPGRRRPGPGRPAAADRAASGSRGAPR